MAFKVGELMTPATVGGMAEQDADAVAITGGTITGDGAPFEIDNGLFENGYIELSSIILRISSVASIGTVGSAPGWIQYVSDGDGGSPCLAVSDGTVDGGGSTVWKRVALGAAIST